MSALLAAPVSPVWAETPAAPQPQSQSAPSFTQTELDQMLAPVALYPDQLLSQVLMASTYPLEIVEAARWSRAHPDLKGDEAVRSAANEDWDPSVKSLLAFPDLLGRMDDKVEWTRQLGDAFLGQESQVMDTVQQLRQRAQANGDLRSDERQRVTDDGGTIAIAPTNPQVVYVPYYDPTVVYGSWWWPAYPPVYWGPWPGYAVAYPGFWWGVGIGVSAGFFFGSVSWHSHSVVVVHSNVYYARPSFSHHSAYAHQTIAVGQWHHDPTHRHNVNYRSPAAQQRYAHWEPQRGTAAQRLDASHRGSAPGAPRGAPRNDSHGHAMPPAMRSSSPSMAEGHSGRAAPRPRADPPAGFNPPRPASAREMPQPRFGSGSSRGDVHPSYGGQGGGYRGQDGGFGGQGGSFGGHGGGFGGHGGGHGG
ncbi:MAG: DUF3300 domain-containing protein [Burkholderiales bacterium]